MNTSEFKIATKAKELSIIIDNLVQNIPKKDYYLKDQLRNNSIELLRIIYLLNNDDNKDNILLLNRDLKANISIIDFMLEKLYNYHYISEKILTKSIYKLTEINKMSSIWVKHKVDNGS